MHCVPDSVEAEVSQNQYDAFMMRAVIVVSLLLTPVLFAQATKFDTAAYEKCQEAVRKNAVENAIRDCSAPAVQGIPGAQYGLGVLLVNRGTTDDLTAGIKWLEKAHAAGNPAAAFALSRVYGRQSSGEAKKRVHDLFQEAACAGYPAAVSELMKHADVTCAERSPGFVGDWIANLKWVKTELPAEGGFDFKISVGADGTVKVFRKSAAAWSEVKQGKFAISVLDQTAIVSVLDSGWDFEGKWIESWSI